MAKVKTLIIFRLFDKTYGPIGNPRTLAVYLEDDKTLGYSYYGGWQNSGSGYSIDNMQLKLSLPMNSRLYTTARLVNAIESVLRTGVGSHHVASFEILNELPKELKAKPKTKVKSIDPKKLKELWGEAKELINFGSSREKAEGVGMLKVLNELKLVKTPKVLNEL